MRIVLKALFKGVMALSTIAMMTLTLRPATDAEATALGRDNNRFMLVQMRLAKTMLTVAPDFAVARYAQATGLPDYVIRDMLEAKAAGESIIPQNDSARAGGLSVDRARRTDAGGALFATPD